MDPKPWLRNYGAGVPATLEPYPRRTLLDYVTSGARERPAHPALVFHGARLGYGALERQSDALAAWLALMGVRKGDRIALLMPNCPQFVLAELGAWKAGAIVAPLNPLYSERELVETLNRVGAETIVTLSRFYLRVLAIRSRTPLRRVIVTNIKEYLPPTLRVLYTLFREAKSGDRVGVRPGDQSLQRLLRRHAGAPRPAVAVSPDDPALLLMSGGTTGTPKSVIGLHRGLVASGLQLREWLRPILGEWHDTVLLPLPLFHVYGNAGAQSFALIGHNPLILVPNPRDIDDLVKTIQRERPSVFVSVPALFNALLNHREVRTGRVDFRSIKGCFSGAAALMAETKKRFEELTGGRIVEGYSLTEAMMACAVNPVLGTNKIGSVGMPMPDVEVRVVDEDVGVDERETGKVGEIVIRAPQLMAGYWNDPVETRRTLRPLGEGGPWLYTGDLGYLDEDGYLFIVDRKKDLIKVSGLQVWPREVEEVLATHPAVLDAGVAGVPDERKGEAVKAWVVLQPGASVTEAELREHCRASLAAFKVPSAIEFRTELPKTPLGKVLRRQLRAESMPKPESAGVA